MTLTLGVVGLLLIKCCEGHTFMIWVINMSNYDEFGQLWQEIRLGHKTQDYSMTGGVRVKVMTLTLRVGG